MDVHTALRRSVAEAWKAASRLLADAGVLPELPPVDDARARALWLRQNRNTGPASTVRLDGHRRKPGGLTE